jgi:broad specificity phosphatase PhoE
MPSELGQDTSLNFDENEVPITVEGRKKAQQIGVLISGQYDAIYYSPILRCKQTAEFISLGSGVAIVGALSFLSSDFFNELTSVSEIQKQDIVAAMLRGEEYGYDYNKLSEKMEFLLARFERLSGKERSIFVTHDWWMSLFLSWYTPLFESKGYAIWPNFLESFIIDFKRNEIMYRNDCFSLPNALPA